MPNLQNLMEQIKAAAQSGSLAVPAGIALVAALCLLCLLAGRLLGRLEMTRDMRRQRRDAVKRSRSVVKGQVSEQLAPFLPGFPCDVGDVQFIGRPVDFVAFCGDSGSGTVDEIVFIEVKSGAGSLSAREKSVCDAVEGHRVRYVEYRIPD